MPPKTPPPPGRQEILARIEGEPTQIGMINFGKLITEPNGPVGAGDLAVVARTNNITPEFQNHFSTSSKHLETTTSPGTEILAPEAAKTGCLVLKTIEGRITASRFRFRGERGEDKGRVAPLITTMVFDDAYIRRHLSQIAPILSRKLRAEPLLESVADEQRFDIPPLNLPPTESHNILAPDSLDEAAREIVNALRTMNPTGLMMKKNEKLFAGEEEFLAALGRAVESMSHSKNKDDRAKVAQLRVTVGVAEKLKGPWLQY